MNETYVRWQSMLKDAPHNDYCNADLIEELHDALMSEAMANQDEQLRQKDETIAALAKALEDMTFTAAGLHDLYRGDSKTPSDGSHEAAFKAALELVAKAGRKP
jgi:hypothetical protein